MLLTGPSGLDRAQVITVDIKINTFRFSKWRTSSFSAVGPKNRAVTVHVDLVFIIMCAVGYQWGLSSSFLGEQFRRGCHSDAPLSCPHYGSCHSPSSHLTCSEPRSKAEPSFYFRACSSVLSHLRRASGMLQEQFMGFTAFLPLWDGHPCYLCFTGQGTEAPCAQNHGGLWPGMEGLGKAGMPGDDNL